MNALKCINTPSPGSSLLIASILNLTKSLVSSGSTKRELYNGLALILSKASALLAPLVIAPAV